MDQYQGYGSGANYNNYHRYGAAGVDQYKGYGARDDYYKYKGYGAGGVDQYKGYGACDDYYKYRGYGAGGADQYKGYGEFAHCCKSEVNICCEKDNLLDTIALLIEVGSKLLQTLNKYRSQTLYRTKLILVAMAFHINSASA